MTIREYIEEISTDEPIIVADGLDEALIGVTNSSPIRAVYSVQKILDILITRDGMSKLEAIEFFDFNIADAFVGECTPIYVNHP